jgi:hypothetical protein
MADKLGIPRLSYNQIRKQADAFLAKYNPAGTIPVPIEEIAEFELGLNIIPIPNLQGLLEIDGFISSDLRSITVDEFVLERRVRRYRFTLAHEIGHLWLHGDIFRALNFKNIDEWKKFQTEIDTEDYSWLEYQGYAFGGLVLAPAAPLGSQKALCEQDARREGLTLETEAANLYICTMLAKIFNVSEAVIEKRLNKDK